MLEIEDPLAEYSRRLKAREKSLVEINRRDLQWSNIRFILFLIVLALLVFGWFSSQWSMAWALVPAMAFIVAVQRHDRVLRIKRRLEDAVRFFEEGIRRIEGRWMGSGKTGKQWQPEDHLYAEDLDLYGEGSLFELFCTCRTLSGESKLARWLGTGADPDEIQFRQDAVRELTPRVDEREALYLDCGDVRATVRPDLLIDWCKDAGEPPSRHGQFIAWALPMLAGLLVVLWVSFGVTPVGLVLIGILEMLYLRSRRAFLEKALMGLDKPLKDLEILKTVLKRMESERFESDRLRALHDSLKEGQENASHAIGRLSRRVAAAESLRNQFFVPLWILLLWPIHCANSINSWRRQYGQHVEQWLDAVGEYESLSALAGYSYEHPSDPFPEFVDEKPFYDAKALGHPILPESICVRNDVRLDAEKPMWMVSGSNMSGKSTLLRTVGVNAVLAMAGAPVRAESLRLSPLVLGASLHVVDSIQKGASHFYAEIERLKAIQDLTGGDRPVLFLVDEILHGTNSHDRRIGAEAVLKSLLEAGAFGLVTTHDLAIDGESGVYKGRGRNAHFIDHMEDDKLCFDYVVRPGVVQHSNALKLMRRIGLDVQDA